MRLDEIIRTPQASVPSEYRLEAFFTGLVLLWSIPDNDPNGARSCHCGTSRSRTERIPYDSIMGDFRLPIFLERGVPERGNTTKTLDAAGTYDTPNITIRHVHNCSVVYSYSPTRLLISKSKPSYPELHAKKPSFLGTSRWSDDLRVRLCYYSYHLLFPVACHISSSVDHGLSKDLDPSGSGTFSGT